MRKPSLRLCAAWQSIFTAATLGVSGTLHNAEHDEEPQPKFLCSLCLTDVGTNIDEAKASELFIWICVPFGFVNLAPGMPEQVLHWAQRPRDALTEHNEQYRNPAVHLAATGQSRTRGPKRWLCVYMHSAISCFQPFKFRNKPEKEAE